MNIIERGARAVDGFQQRHPPAAFLFGVIKKFGDDNAGSLVANLAYSGLGAVFPLLLLLVTVLGVVLGHDPGLRHSVVDSALSEFPVVGQQLGNNIHALDRHSVVGLVVGLAGLLWGSLGLAQNGIFAMNQVWNLPGPERPNYVKRLGRSLAFLGVLGVGVAVSAAAAGVSTFGDHAVWLTAVGPVVSALVNCAEFLFVFRVLTPKAVETRRLWPGAVVAGVGWTILQAVGGYLVGHDLRNDSEVYGTFALVLGLMAWVYLAAELTVYAAEVNVVIARRLWPRGMVQPPLTDADQRSMAAQATENQRRPEQQVHVSFSEPAATEDEARRTG